MQTTVLLNPKTLQKYEAKRIKGVYFLFQDDEIVYVGQSVDIHARISVHMSDENKEFDSFSFIEFSDDNLDIHEGDYIMEYRPFLNSTMPKGARWKSQAQLKSVLKTGAHAIKRWAKANRIRTENGFYNIADFASFNDKEQS